MDNNEIHSQNINHQFSSFYNQSTITFYTTISFNGSSIHYMDDFSLNLNQNINIINPIQNDNYSSVYKNTGNITANNETSSSAASSTTSSSSSSSFITIINGDDGTINNEFPKDADNYWALLALVLVFGTAAGNILVCLAIAWERRLQNVTNYFLMSLAITDLMVAVLVMPLGILTLVKGYFPLQSEHCLVWICLDVLFCTASIMHLCTISVDRYLSLRYPMRFGRNKTRRRVTLKIVFVWLLSIAMSLPLSLMYSKNHASVLVNGTCQIPDPVYKLVGSIVCFYIPLGVMLLTYCLTVRLLAQQRQNLGGTNNQTSGWASGWLGQTPALERRCTWKRLLKTNSTSTPNHAHSAASTDTELSTLDTHELWLPDSSIPEPTPSTMTALHQFGAEMLKLSRGLESVGSSISTPQHSKHEFNSQNMVKDGNHLQYQRQNKHQQQQSHHHHHHQYQLQKFEFDQNIKDEERLQSPSSIYTKHFELLKKRRASASNVRRPDTPPPISRKRFHSLPKNALIFFSGKPSTSSSLSSKNNQNNDDMNFEDNHFNTTTTENSKSEKICYDKNRHQNNNKNNDDYLKYPPPCTCPYFGDRPLKCNVKPTEVKIISSTFRSSSSSQESSDLLVVTSSSAASETGTTITTFTTSTNKSPTSGGGGGGGGGSSGINSSTTFLPLPPPTPTRKLSYSKTTSVVTWDSGYSNKRRGSSFGSVKTSLLSIPTKLPFHQSSPMPLRRSATLKNHNNISSTYNINETGLSGGGGSGVGSTSLGGGILKSNKIPSSPCILQRNATVRSHHSRNSSVISRNSSRHGRIIRLEQKATKVLGVVFFTFVILWAPFFVLNLVPSVCGRCEENISHWVFDVVTWLGYASSMVNPIFYTIFNKVFRQAFKKVLLCKYSGGNTSKWRPER